MAPSWGCVYLSPGGYSWLDLNRIPNLMTFTDHFWLFLRGAYIINFSPKGCPCLPYLMGTPIEFPSISYSVSGPLLPVLGLSTVILSYSCWTYKDAPTVFHYVTREGINSATMVSSFSSPQDSWRPNCIISLTTLESLFYQAHKTEMAVIRFQY